MTLESALFLLLDSGVKATVLLGLVAVGVRVFAHRRPALRTLLWNYGLVALLLLPPASLLLPDWHVPLLPFRFEGAPAEVAFVAEVVPFASDRMPVPMAEVLQLSPGQGPSDASHIPRAWPQWPEVVLGIYALGVGIGLFRFALGWWRVRALRLQVHRFAGVDLMVRLDRWCRSLDIHQAIDIGISHTIRVPTVIGIVRPLIVVPGDLAAKGAKADWDGILVHELAHVKRRDTLWNAVGLVVSALYWYHPLVHWARCDLADAREYACDDWAVSALGHAGAYATTLLEVTAHTDRRLSQALGLDMARTPRVLHRVHRMLDTRFQAAPRMGKRASGALLLVMLVCVGLLGSMHPVSEAARGGDKALQADGEATYGAFMSLLSSPADNPDAEHELARFFGVLRGQAYAAGADAVARARYRSALWAFVNRPAFRDARLMGQAYSWLFHEVRADAEVQSEDVRRVAQGLVAYQKGNPMKVFCDAPILLADRTPYYREAEAIARQGFEAVQAMQRRPAGFYEQVTAGIHGALGWIYFREGRLAEAEQALLTSHALYPDPYRNLYHLGQFYAHTGDLDRAEAFYFEGMYVNQWRNDHLEWGLREVFHKRHGHGRGVDAYLATKRRDAEMHRKQYLLSRRLSLPAPDARFACLDGSEIALSDLRGKVVVLDMRRTVNPAMLDHVQHLHARFAGRGDVVVLHINQDGGLADLAQGGDYGFSMVLSRAFLDEMQIVTSIRWFMDRQGRIAYQAGDGLREAIWRVEALLANEPAG